MGDLSRAARGAGGARGLKDYIEDRTRREGIQKNMTGMMELSMKNDRVGAFTRNIRDTSTHVVVADDGSTSVEWKPEFLTISSRGPEKGAPDYLKLSTLIFQQALNTGLYPEEYKDFVMAYGETYSIPNTVMREMLNTKAMGAMVDRLVALQSREKDNIIDGSKHQLNIDSAVGDANKGLSQNLTNLGPSEMDKTIAGIVALSNKTALPSQVPKSRSDIDIIAQLGAAAANGDTDAENALKAINLSKAKGSVLGATLKGDNIWGKPGATERKQALDQQSLMYLGNSILGTVQPKHFGTGFQLGIGLSKFGSRVKDLKLMNIPVGEWIGKTADELAEMQGVTKASAEELKREYQLVQGPAKMMAIAFRRAWTGVAFRREEMIDYEKALPTLDKDDYTTFVTKVQSLVDFTEDAQARLIAMLFDGVVTTEQIRENQVPDAVFDHPDYYVTPLSTTGGIQGRRDGAETVRADKVEKVKRDLKLKGQTPEQWLQANDAIPYIRPEEGEGGGPSLGAIVGTAIDGLDGITRDNLGFGSN